MPTGGSSVAPRAGHYTPQLLAVLLSSLVPLTAAAKSVEDTNGFAYNTVCIPKEGGRDHVAALAHKCEWWCRLRGNWEDNCHKCDCARCARCEPRAPAPPASLHADCPGAKYELIDQPVGVAKIWDRIEREQHRETHFAARVQVPTWKQGMVRRCVLHGA